MNKILEETTHRPFTYPERRWTYYQEWNNVLFLHWEVSYKVLRALVPPRLQLDLFEGKAYVSLVAFTMQRIRPRYLPAVRALSDFDEINIRTYIHNNGKPGVYFLSIEAGKILSAKVARALSGLPYQSAVIHREEGRYESVNPSRDFRLHLRYKIGLPKRSKTALDRWLTERYSLYLYHKNVYYYYAIHHLEWDIRELEWSDLEIAYRFGDLELLSVPQICHYSKGVKVLAWDREKLKK